MKKGKKKLPADPISRHKVMRELYRNYMQFREYVRTTGEYVIEYNDIAISFYDMGKGLNDLSPRKKEAFYLNVILDKKQKDVAEIMGITTVSVGQYVEAASRQLAEIYFGEAEDE